MIAEMVKSLCFGAFRTTANKLVNNAYPAAGKLQLRPVELWTLWTRSLNGRRNSEYRTDAAIEYDSNTQVVSGCR
jgi:hypothetical protein